MIWFAGACAAEDLKARIMRFVRAALRTVMHNLSAAGAFEMDVEAGKFLVEG